MICLAATEKLTASMLRMRLTKVSKYRIRQRTEVIFSISPSATSYHKLSFSLVAEREEIRKNRDADARPRNHLTPSLGLPLVYRHVFTLHEWHACIQVLLHANTSCLVV